MRGSGRRRVVVVACGQADRGDDAVALVAADRLVSMGFLARDGPDPDLRIAGALEVEDVLAIAPGEALVVVDAVDGPAPGEIVVRPLAALLPLAGTASGALSPRSTHAVSIPDALAIAAALRPERELPPGSFVGMGIASVALGEGLSRAVAAALPAFVDAVRAEVTRLRGD